MHQRWKTFRDSCSTRKFYLVGEENSLKHQKNWRLGVAPGSVVSSLIYLIESGQKWHILVEITFDPCNCLETPNKHSETFLHIPMPHQRPKEHQNWAFISIFRILKWPWKPEMRHEKWIFWLFSQFFPIFSIQWTQKPVPTNLPIKIPHWGHKGHHIWPMGTGFRSGNGHN